MNSFSVIKCRFTIILVGGGTDTEVERNADVLRVRAVSRSHYLFIRKEDFYISVVQQQFL